MEEKYTQIKLNLGSVKGSSVKGNSDVEEKQDSSFSKLDDPETIPMDIAENRQVAQLDADVSLVSPDETIFTMVAENVNKTNKKSELASDWHSSEGDSDENFIVDELYASTAHADRKFMETFGIKTDGNKKIIHGFDNTNESEETSENNEYEYTERLQNQEIKSMYDYAVKGMGKRLLFSGIFALMLFFVENLTLFVKDPQGIFDAIAHPYIHAGVSLGLLVLCAICGYEQIYHGFRSILSREYMPESVTVVALIIAIIHNGVTFILISFGYTGISTFNFVAAILVAGTILYSFVNIVREEFGFRAISGKDTKFILERVQQKEAEAEYDTFTTTSSEFNGEIARVGKTGFVKNFFRNTNSSINISKFMGIYYIIAIIVPVVFAIISAVRLETATLLTAHWGMGVMLMLPIGILCAYSVPFYVGNKRLFEDGVAVIGEEAVSEFAEMDVVVVNDTTAFPPQNIKIQHFHVYNDFTLEKVLYYASNGFSLVGGSLAEVFDSAANETIVASKRVRFLCSGRSYLCMKIDNDKVIFADKFGMTSQGIEVGNERESRDGTVMYVAVNSVLAAKLYIKYEIDDEFLKIVRLLNKNGTGVGVRTFDPNLNNELIKKLSSFKKRDLRVIKLTTINEVSKPSVSKDARVASKGLSRSLIKAIPVCKKIISTRKVLRAIKIIASIGGAVLMGLWALGKLSFICSAHIVGYHLVFVILMSLASLVCMPKLK